MTRMQEYFKPKFPTILKIMHLKTNKTFALHAFIDTIIYFFLL